MILHRSHFSGWNGVFLSSVGGFLSLSDLANLSGTGRVWRHLLDHPCLGRIVRGYLQREWWVTCSLKQLKARGFQAIRKQADVSIRFPYKLHKFMQGSRDQAIRSCYLGDGHWVSMAWDGQVKFWKKPKSTSHNYVGMTPSIDIGKNASLQSPSPICMLNSMCFVVVGAQNSYLMNMAVRKIQKLRMSPQYAVFRWWENQVVFASYVDKITELRLCSIEDTKCTYTSYSLSSGRKIDQVIPCSDKSGVLSTSRGVFLWNPGKKNGPALQTSPTDTFWTILPLNYQKIVVRDGLEAVVRVWDIEQCKKERSDMYSSQLQMTKLPNASFLLYAHNEKRAVFVDPLVPKPIQAFTSPEKGFTGAVWTGNGPYVVTSYDKNIHFWDMRRHQIIQSMVLPEAMRVVDRMASGDLFLQDPLNRFVALLTPPSIIKSPQDKTL